jgi:DNA-binding transcriptional LysR family regulator
VNQIKFDLMDLNLLRVFDTISEEGSVASAAERLALTPSAVSHSLARLRSLLNDELFVRGPHGMQPTQRAAAMSPRVRELLFQLKLALAPSTFSPEEAEYQFTINCGPYVSAVFLPKFTKRLRAEASRCSLKVKWGGEDIVDELDAGRIDVAIGCFGQIPARFDIQDLFSDRLVWALSAKHAPPRGPLTLDQLAKMPHLISTTYGENPQGPQNSVIRHGLERHVPLNDHGHLERALAERGLSRTIALTVPGTLAALSIVHDSDMAALVPRRHALVAARANRLRLFETPYPSQPIEIKCIWHREFGVQPTLIWFRQLLKEVASDRSPASADD